MFLKSGKDLLSRVMFDPSSNATGIYAPAVYVALSESATAISDNDTTLPGELNAAGGGLNRKQATYGHSNGTNTATLTASFTKNAADGGSGSPATRSVAKSMTFNASSGGTAGFEQPVSPVAPLIDGDSVTIPWTYAF